MRGNRHHVLVCLVTAVIIGGCAQTCPRAVTPTIEISHLVALRAKAELLPRRTRLVEAGEAGGRPLRVQVRETGRDTGRALVLAIHGFMMDGSDWDAVAGVLGSDHEIVAVDLPGAGCSDAPEPCLLGPDGYSADELARRVWLVVRQLKAEGRIRNGVLLVGESLGAVIALRMLGNPIVRAEFQAERAAVIGAVLQAPTDVVLGAPNEAFRELAELGSVQVAVGDMLGKIESGCKAFIATNTDDSCPAPLEEAGRMRRLLVSPERRRAMQSTLRGVVPFDDEGRPDWTEIERREEYLMQVDVPCLLVWGHRDTLVPVGMGYKMVQQIPRSRLVVVPATKHFLPSWERPTQFAELVRGFESSVRSGAAGPAPMVERIALRGER